MALATLEVIMKLRDNVFNAISTLKLSGVKEALNRQLASPELEEMGFLDRLYDLLCQEESETRQRKIAYLLKQAKLRWPNALIEDIKYELHPSLKPATINELAQLTWVDNANHIIITGATGTGKTYIACALARVAIYELTPVLYFRYSELVLQLVAANKNEKLVAFKRRLNKAPIVVIDDWGITPLNAVERNLLFELIESRDRKGSWLITSQYPTNEWYDAFQEPTIADASLDRIVHQAHNIVLKGESIRKAMGLKGGAS